jgi:hypothetical protein
MKSKIIFSILLFTFIQSKSFASNCLFGTELSDLVSEPSQIFEVRDLGVQVKVPRTETNSEVLRVQVYELTDKKTQLVYHVNYTKEDLFDGGNSFGWIEDFDSLEVVGDIQDSAIYNCKVRK